MKEGVRPGLKHQHTFTVNADMAAKHFGPGVPSVLSTPSMILLMEITCGRLMVPYFEEDESTVGFHVDVRHLASTRIGQRVTVTARLEEVDGRRFRFHVEATNDQGVKVGEGTHRRALINIKEFTRAP